MEGLSSNGRMRKNSLSKGRMKRNILLKQKNRQRMKRSILVSLVIVQSLCIIFLSIDNNILKNARNEKNDIINETISTSTELGNEKAKILSKVSSSENVVSITMNGMSDKNYMEEVLNILDEYKIKTTFFLSGTRVAEEPDIAKEIINRGHAIGNYTLTQKNDFEKLSVDEMKKELSKTNEILETKVGVVPEYFRCSNSKYSDQVLQVAETYNLHVAVPDFIKVNSSKITTEEEAKKYASYLRKGDILSINMGNNEAVVKGIALLLKEIKEKDYQVLSFKELTDKNQILYNDNYDEMLKILDSDKNEQNISNNVSDNVSKNEPKLYNTNYEMINTKPKSYNADYEIINTENKNSVKNTSLEKNIKEKINEFSEWKLITNYGLLYSNPIKGSGNVFSYAYTTSKSVALTFDGLGNQAMVNGILDALDKSNIKATFFIPGDKVEKNPEIALEILKRGHEIENNTLSGKAMNTVDYQNACKEIGESSKIIKEKLGITTKYVRPRFGKYYSEFIKAAINTGNEVVTYSKNPLDMDMKSAEEIASYIKKEIRRGEIILLNADTNPEVIQAIPMIADSVRDIGYDFSTIDKLYNSQYKRLKLQEIPGYDAIKINNILPNVVPKTISNLNDIRKDAGKIVALTFDDWGTDKTITNILDNLERYNVKATFFIRSNGVETNPNLAKAISDAGHDVASHSYSHLIINESKGAALENELVKSNEALTYAIQRKPEMFFRPPELEVSNRSISIVQAVGYTHIILADLSTHDWDAKLSQKEIVKEVLTSTKNGSIIILHLTDQANGWRVLPNVIEGLKMKGYSFVKISDYIN